MTCRLCLRQWFDEMGFDSFLVGLERWLPLNACWDEFYEATHPKHYEAFISVEVVAIRRQFSKYRCLSAPSQASSDPPDAPITARDADTAADTDADTAGINHLRDRRATLRLVLGGDLLLSASKVRKRAREIER